MYVRFDRYVRRIRRHLRAGSPGRRASGFRYAHWTAAADQSAAFPRELSDRADRMSPAGRKSLPAITLMVCAISISAALFGFLSSSASAADQTADQTADRWYLISFDGKPAGYENVRLIPVADSADGIVLLRCYRRTELRLNRMGRDLTLRARLQTLQQSDGTLLEFSLHRTDASGSRVERTGQRTGGESRFLIQEKITATRRDYETEAPEDTRSPVMTTWLTQSVSDGSSRAIVPVMFPETAAVSDLRIQSHPQRTVRLPDGRSVALHRWTVAPEAELTSVTTMYADDNGTVVRQEKSLLGGLLTFDLVPAETALSAVAGRSLDLEAAAVIPVDRLLTPTAAKREIILDVVVPEGLSVTVPNATFQTATVLSNSVTRINLLPRETPSPTITPAGQKPVIRESRWMPLNDDRVTRLAVIAAAGRTEPFDVCQRAEQYLHSRLQRSPFSTTLIPADKVAAANRGDCTEHAVLLAAMLRTENIPARIVTGLIHTPQHLGFVGHSWVEAWMNGRWLPFDSAVLSDNSGSTRIKLTDSELPDDLTSGVSLFLPVLDLAGRAEIRVVEQ
ncbi:MAG: transglutaminase domain-containing protein [Planctomycetaceae bacterium]|nr:transglutaminase domain-containing protein [Planctomycetaceae bacterium]